MAEDKRAPDYRWEAFPVQLAAWRRTHNDRVFHSFKLTKRYKNDDGDWRTTDNLSERDLPLAGNLLLRAHMELGITKDTP